MSAHLSTSLKLPSELKARIQPLAKQAGVSPHAWMIQALERETAQAEARSAFMEAALQSEAETARTGKTYGASVVHAYAKRLAAREAAERPA